MQYHALSLAHSSPTARVFLVGHRGERCVPQVEAAENITPILIAPNLLPRPRSRALYVLCLPLKAVAQLLQLLWTLLVVLPRPDVLLIQTPPAIPTLAAAWLLRLLRGCSIVVDWHNFGFSVLELSLRAGHPLVRISRAYEACLGRTMDGHLCVTHAMAGWLQAEWRIASRVLHDRPPAFFKPLALAERHAVKGPEGVDRHTSPFTPLPSHLPAIPAIPAPLI
uniref:Glycosyltransferase subfamily 4-like N-terminal domain-containing protein n=1 Tax=Haptolina ericina TaxID=156174 RepID=A0A7S3EQT0_9EUKA